MTGSANIGREREFGAARALSTFNTPAASRFQAMAASYEALQGTTPFNTTSGPITLIGRRQPRFNLVVTHGGIDDRELSALCGRSVVDAHVDARRAHRVGAGRARAA
jgi:hypothetical protein